MADTATRTHVDDDVIFDGVSSLKHHLDGILHELQDVGEATGHRGPKLDKLEQVVDQTEQSVSEMESILDKLAKELNSTELELSQLDSSYQDLMDEQAELDKTGCELYHKVNVQDTYLGQVRKLDQEYEFDLTNARFLRDKMRDELEKKEAALENTQQSLEEQDIAFYKQYENLKMDVRRHKLEASPLLKELDDCNRAILGRLDFYLKSNSISTEDANRAIKLKKYIELTTQHRKAFDQVGDLELEVKNAERVLQYSQTQVKAKFAKIEALERELADTLGESGESVGYCLKSAPRCMDLDRMTELHGRIESQSWPEDEPVVHVGGKGLHKCPKITNIPQQVERGELCEGGQGEVTLDGKKKALAGSDPDGVDVQDVAEGKGKTDDAGRQEKTTPAQAVGALEKMGAEADQMPPCGNEKQRGKEESFKVQGHHLGRDSKSTSLVNPPKLKLRTTSSVRTFQK